MKFKTWFIQESRKELASAYRSLLQDVPQDPHHHPEGNVLNHVQLVRKAIPKAVQELNLLKQSPELGNILSDIDFTISPEEFQILFLSAWLHDIGKASATTIHPETGKIQAIGHEDPEHYLPQMSKIKDFAPPETIALYKQNEQLINFLIERHMDFVNKDGFPTSVLRQYFQNGKVKNSPEMKLLLILMWADKMGRKPEETIAKSIAGNANRLALSSQRSIKRDAGIAKNNANRSFQGSPQEFNSLLKQRGIDSTQRRNALRNKFPDLSDQDLMSIFNN